MNKKFISSFLIALFLVSFIPISGLNGIKNVNAAPVCCEKTSSGGTCQYVEDTECASGSKAAPTNCYFTSYCKLGTCFDLNDGRCYANMPLATCTARGESASFSDLPLESTPQCDVGCCIIGNQASLITQTRCKKETANYPDLQMVFKEDIKDEAACVDLARSSDKGCCVQSSSSCSYTTRDNCPQSTGTNVGSTGFFKGRYCSDADLNCDCTSGKITGKKGCLGGSDDVYYFDSCGNPENIAEDCDYVTKQSTCGFDKSDSTYKCLKLNCDAEDVTTFFYTSSTEIKNGESWCEYDVDSSESTFLGNGRDLPGSRYYRGLCINNKIFVEPCKDFREEWCISNLAKIEGTDYNFAACRLNRWEDCTNQKKKNDCENTDLRDCSWTGGRCVPFVSPGAKFWEEENTDVCSQGNSDCEVIVKVPGLTKLLGEQNIEGKDDIVQNVLQAFGRIMSFGQEGLAEKPSVEAGQGCLKHTYTVSQNNICSSLGDCGASFNILTESGDKYKNTLSGFTITDEKNIDLVLRNAEDGGVPGPITFEDLEKEYAAKKPKKEDDPKKDYSGFLTSLLTNALVKGVYMTGFGLKHEITEGAGKFFAKSTLKFLGLTPKKGAEKFLGSEWLAEKLSGFLAEETIAPTGGGKFLFEKVSDNAVKKLTDILSKKSNEELTILMQKAGVTASKGTTGAQVMAEKLIADAGKDPTNLAALEKQFGTKIIEKSGIANIMSILNFASWLHLGLSLIDMIGTDMVKVNIQTTCKPWQAPANSNDCAKCNPDDASAFEKTPWRTNKKCSEYTCKSFGQSCVLLNQGTGNETCVSQNPRDVIPPIITPWLEGLGTYDKKIDNPTSTRGYSYKEVIPAYTVFPMAIETSEPAQCRVSLNQSTAFDNMDTFGSGIYNYYHLVIGSLPVTYGIQGNGTVVPMPGTDYTLFIKCQDSLGNKNEAPYYIKYTIQKGPDVTPPLIEGASISDNSYFAYGINQSDIEVYVNEPSDCKWSQTNQDYDKMENNLICSKTPNDFSLYTCTTTIKPLIDQIVNKFYFRCKDQPMITDPKITKNTNEQSFELTLRGSYPLKIDSIEPSGQIYTRNFTLKVETSKGATYDGKAYCYYGDNLDINLMTLFYKTNSSYHEQVLSPARSSTPYNYYVSCVDYGGNFANASTNITMSQDTKAPKIVTIYEDTSYTPSRLKIILDEVADCQYRIGKDFTYGSGDGISMATDSKEQDAIYEDGATYYIRCLDASNNLMLHIFHA